MILFVMATVEFNYGHQFLEKVHSRQNEWFRNETAVRDFMNEYRLPDEDLARMFVMRMPLTLHCPEVLVPYATHALPSGSVSTLQTQSVCRSYEKPIVVMDALPPHDADTFLNNHMGRGVIILPHQIDPFQRAKQYLDLCTMNYAENPDDGRTFYATRYLEGGDRAVFLCRKQ